MRAARPPLLPPRFLLTAAGGGAVLLAFFLCMIVLPLPASARPVVEDALLVVSGLVGSQACADAARRSSGSDSRAWWLLTATLSLWAAGNAAYLVHDARQSPGRAMVAFALFAVALPCGFVACTQFTRAPALRATRVRRALDALTVVSSAAYVTWDVTLRTVLTHSTGSGALTASLFPLGDLGLVSLVVLVVAAAPAEQRISLSLVGWGVAAFAVADNGSSLLRALGRYAGTAPSDAGWIVGAFLCAVAARCFGFQSRAMRLAQRASDERDRGVPAWRSAFLPYALVVPVVAATVLDMAHHRFPDTVALLLGCLLAVFVVSHQITTIAENIRLVVQLTGREAELREQALHDVLTGLANRRLFSKQLEDALATCDADEVAVVFVDLDDFKLVNDTLGHATGDELLHKVALRLTGCTREGDVSARLGGDEFAVLLTSGGLAAAHHVATRITRAMRQPVVCSGHPIFIQASVGIAAGGAATGHDSEQLLEQADMAMYAAKDAGKARLAVFEPAMRDRLLDRAAVREDLARALGRGQLHLHYQPIVDLWSGRVLGAEALLRWLHPQRGAIPPTEFIPLAEETGLISPIGRWVLRQACAEAASWQQWYAGSGPRGGFQINVNVSAGQLLTTEVVDEVRDVLASTGLAASLLTIEITESVLMADNAAVAAQLAALKRLGVALAIDDFGTGYSGLSYLDRLPVDVLKVDKAFVERLDQPSTRPPLAGAVVGLADLLGLDVVAEGVENAAQRHALAELGCERGQGYYFSRPVDAPAMRALLRPSAVTLGGGALPERLRGLGA